MLYRLRALIQTGEVPTIRTNPSARKIHAVKEANPCAHCGGDPFGGYAGSHAEYVRVPFGDTNCYGIPGDITEEQALYLSDAALHGR